MKLSDIMDAFIDRHAKALAEAVTLGRGYSLKNENGTLHLLFVPGVLFEGDDVRSGLVVSQVGFGSAILHNPASFNKFVFVQGGLTTHAGDIATRTIRGAIAHLSNRPVVAALEGPMVNGTV